MVRIFAALILGLSACVPAVHAQDDWKPDPGFKSLFNGKDLTGWQLKGKKDDLTGKSETANKRFQVVKGAIFVNPGGGDLYTTDSFDSDFVVRMEFRAGVKADSGVFIRGPQLQIRDFKRRNEQKHLTKYKDDDWNLLVITVKGTEATYTLNDEPLKGPDKMKVPAKGGIGLQSESGTFEYRRIQIKVEGGEKKSAQIDAPRESPVLAQNAAGTPKKRLLLITESRGFVHGVVNRGKKDTCLVEDVFIELAKKHPFFEVDYTQDSRSVITGENLKKYDAVFFYTTGELPLSDAQKSDLLAFVKKGNGFGGSHCATDTFYKWKEYGELIGAYFDGHPWHQKVKVIVEDKNHPSTKHLGESFEINDEIYQFRAPYSREKLRVLLKLDLTSVKNQGKRADKDNALAWTHEYGKGRVFYTALGHREDVWTDPRFQQHVIGGLRYMFGLEK